MCSGNTYACVWLECNVCEMRVHTHVHCVLRDGWDLAPEMVSRENTMLCMWALCQSVNACAHVRVCVWSVCPESTLRSVPMYASNVDWTYIFVHMCAGYVPAILHVVCWACTCVQTCLSTHL